MDAGSRSTSWGQQLVEERPIGDDHKFTCAILAQESPRHISPCLPGTDTPPRSLMMHSRSKCGRSIRRFLGERWVGQPTTCVGCREVSLRHKGRTAVELIHRHTECSGVGSDGLCQSRPKVFLLRGNEVPTASAFCSSKTGARLRSIPRLDNFTCADMESQRNGRGLRISFWQWLGQTGSGVGSQHERDDNVVAFDSTRANLGAGRFQLFFGLPFLRPQIYLRDLRSTSRA